MLRGEKKQNEQWLGKSPQNKHMMVDLIQLTAQTME